MKQDKFIQAGILSVKSSMHLHFTIVGVGRLVLHPGLDPTCGDPGGGGVIAGIAPRDIFVCFSVGEAWGGWLCGREWGLDVVCIKQIHKCA